MLYQLPNGRAIYLTVEEYLSLTDDEINFLVAYEYGSVLNNPRHSSVLGKNNKEDRDVEEDYYNDPDLERVDELDTVSEEARAEDLDSADME